MMTLRERIIIWAKEKGILDGSNAISQLSKLEEEVEELAIELMGGDHDFAMIELGDVLVVCTIIAEFMNVTSDECLQLAYDKIVRREGKMINGVFVKDD